MNIMEMLKDEELHVRITYGDKWLIYSDSIWVIYEKQYGSRRTTKTEFETEEKAVEGLLKD